MRMKMFAAETFEAAKAMIFAEMGADAVILSEREIDGGVEVRAAVDKMGGVGRGARSLKLSALCVLWGGPLRTPQPSPWQTAMSFPC